MVRTIIHGARIGVQMGFSIPIKFPSDCGGEEGGQSGQGLLVLPPRCEIFLVRTLRKLAQVGLGEVIEHANYTERLQSGGD